MLPSPDFCVASFLSWIFAFQDMVDRERCKSKTVKQKACK